MISLDEALTRLQAINTENLDPIDIPAVLDEIKSLVDQIEINSGEPYKTTILYSGGVGFEGSSVSANSLAVDVYEQAGSDVRIINNTDAAKFLTSDEFISKTAAIYGLELDDLPDLSGEHPLNQWLYNSDPNNSLWASTSKRFAEATVGEVRVIAPQADVGRVFGAVELPALLANENITTIDGVDISQYRSITSEGGSIDEVFDSIKANSFAQINLTDLANGGISDYLDINPDNYDSWIANKDANGRYYLALDNLLKKSFSEFSSIQDALDSSVSVTEIQVSSGAISSALNKLGPAALLLSFSMASTQALAEEEAGNSEKAREIMELWAVDAAGSAAGEVAGAAIGGAALALLAAVGLTVSAPLAAVAVLGAALIGGILGADSATGIYELASENDDDFKKKLIEDIGEILFPNGHAVDDIPAKLDGENIALITNFSVEQFVSEAQDSLAWRYALQQLNPFVISGDESLYDRFNQNGELELDNFSEAYVQDRAAMLIANSLLVKSGGDGVSGTVQGAELGIYQDLSISENSIWISDREIRLNKSFPIGTDEQRHIIFGTDSHDTVGLQGKNRNDHIYGMAGNDVLKGNIGEDYLDGGVGNDTLIGGKDNDELFGGAGADTYVINAGDGVDTIIDAADTGDIITINGYDLSSLNFEETASGSDVFIDKAFNDDSGTPEISVYKLGSQIKIVSRFNGEISTVNVQTYNNGDYGFSLTSFQEPQTPPSSGTDYLVGDGTISRKRLEWSYDGRAGNNKQSFVNQQNILYNADLYYPQSDYQDERRNFQGGDLNDILEGSQLLNYGELNIIGDYLWGKDGNDAMWGDGINNHSLGGTDVLIGGKGSDQIFGGGEFDILFAQDQELYADYDPNHQYENVGDEDYLSGGDGDDRLYGGSYNDILDGGNDEDAIGAGAGNDTAYGGDGDDYIFGDSFYLYNNENNGFDFLNHDSARYSASFTYDDTLVGGAGVDHIYGELGDDIITGGTDDDYLIGDRMNHQDFIGGHLSAGGFYQTLDVTYHGNDYILGDSGNDHIFGNGGDDFLDGGSDADVIQGDDRYTSGAAHGSDTIFGGAGADTIEGNGGDDTIWGGTENDNIWGDSDGMITYYSGDELTLDGLYHGNDVINAGDGDDFVNGGGGDDSIVGGEGNDRLFGDSVGETTQFVSIGFSGDGVSIHENLRLAVEFHGADTLDGGAGDDYLAGGAGNDTLLGGADNDALDGGEGDDTLLGGAGHDDILGGAGNDQIQGGTGNDALAGGLGADTYIFSAGDGYDHVEDASGASTLVFDGGITKSDLSVAFSTDGNGNDIVNITYGTDRISMDSYTYLYLKEFQFSDGEILSKYDFVREFVGGAQGYTTPPANSLLLIPASQDPSGLSVSAQNNDLSVNLGSGIGGGFGSSGSGSILATTLGAYQGLYQSLVLQEDGQGDYISSSGITLVGGFNSTDGNSYLSGIALADESGYTVVQSINDASVYRTINGSDGADSIVAGDTTDTIRGYGGDDVISSGKGKDSLYGGEGDDTLNGGEGNDNLYGDAGDDTLSGGEGRDYLNGGDGQDTLNGGDDRDTLRGEADNDILNGESGNDNIFGGYGNDYLTGGSGNDYLYGEADTDYLFGGEGNDDLDGGSGSDIYYYNLGEGLDTIHNYDVDVASVDQVQLGDDIYLSDVLVTRENNNLTIYLNEKRALIFSNFFNGDEYQIDEIIFADGFKLTSQDLAQMAATPYALSQTLYGDSSNNILDGLGGFDDIHGQDGNDELYGSDGNDTLYGDGGDDLLIGGTGNDTLYGGTGNDTYYYQAGDGVDHIGNVGAVSDYDRILFEEGIISDNVTLRRYENDLQVWVNQALAISVMDHFIDGIDAVQFSDGTIWDQAYIDGAVSIATAENDNLYGDDADNILSGLAGDDFLAGGLGSDSYQFSLHDGNDRISDYGSDALSIDRIEFDNTVQSNDLEVIESGYDLVLFNTTTGDSVTLEYYFASWFSDQSMKEVHFSDGTVWHDTELLQRLTRNEISGTDQDDLLSGNAGDNMLSGGQGNDTLLGGAGDDKLYGSGGDDVLEGGADNDEYSLGAGNNTVIYSYGDGFDSITSSAESAVNTLILKNIEPSDVVFHIASSGAPELRLSDNSGGIEIGKNLYNLNELFIDSVHFDDGTIWDINALQSRLLSSTPFDDGIIGSSASDTLLGASGNDVLQGGADHDWLKGNSGDDVLHGGSGNDTLAGGAGNDSLEGSVGDDVYLIDTDDGHDRIIYAPYAVGSDFEGSDRIVFGAGIVSEDVVNLGGLLSIKGYEQTVEIGKVVDFQLEFTEQPELILNISDLQGGADFSLDDYYQHLGINAAKLTEGVILDAFSYRGGLVTTHSDDVIFYALENIWAGDGNDILVSAKSPFFSLSSDNQVIDGGLGDDEIYGGGSNNTLYGGPSIIEKYSSTHFLQYGEYGGSPYPEDDDWKTYPEDGDDLLMGEGGDDELHGGRGDDILIGGRGDDVLSGGDGHDIYQFNIGDGHDRIISVEQEGFMHFRPMSYTDPDTDYRDDFDILQFGENINTQDVLVFQKDKDLVFSFTHSDDRLTVENFFASNAALQQGIKEVKFHDGSQWNITDLVALAVPYAETNNNALYGDDANNILTGDGNDNVLIALNGADTLIGGAGDDYLVGGNSSDEYRFSIGFGHDVIDNYDDTYTVASGLAHKAVDVIEFDASIDKSNVVLAKDNNDLVITHDSDSIRVKNHFLGDGLGFNYRYAIDEIRFADGSAWNADQFNQLDTDHINTAPIAISDFDSTSVNRPIVFSVSELLANDYDLDGGILSIVDVLNSQNGTVVLDDVSGTVTFTPDDDYVGAARFEYLVSDGKDTSTGIAVIQINNSAPNPTADIASVSEDTVLTLNVSDLLLNDSDADGDALSIVSISNVSDGVGVLDGDQGVITFTPDENFNGLAGLDYTVSDGITESTASVSIDVTAVNDTPTTLSDSFSMTDTQTIVIAAGNLLDNDSDEEGDQLSLLGVQNTSDGTVIYDPQTDSVAVTADTHFLGDLAFEYLVSDGQSTAVGQAVVTVEPDLSRPNTWIGTSSSEAITGTSADDYLFGFDSDDTLNGDDGNDTLVGGTGNDTLEGGKGDDHYIFGAGDGVDTIVNASSGKPGNDSLHLNGDLNPDNLWFTQLGNDLVIDVVGTNDQITARDWYSDSSAQIDAIYADDQVLYANQVDQLVAAMASFDVPTGVGAIVPQDTRDQVAPVIASSWS